MFSDATNETLIVGDSLGYAHILDLKSFNFDFGNEQPNSKVKVTQYWRAHTKSITSVFFSKEQSIILTAGKDACVRLWSLAGEHIGTFGDKTWAIHDSSTFIELPPRLQHDNEERMALIDRATKFEHGVKQNIIETWKGIMASSLASDNILDDKQALLRTHRKATQIAVSKRWKELWALRKNQDDWQIHKELTTLKSNFVNCFYLECIFLSSVEEPQKAARKDCSKARFCLPYTENASNG